MKRKLLQRPVLFISAVALIAGMVGFAGVLAMTSTKRQVSEVTLNSEEPSRCEVTECVALKDKVAVPDTLTVPVGSTVQFNSADGKKHSLSLGEGGEEHVHTGPFSSGDFDSDEAWRVQFNDKGTYIFHDHYSPEISVLVVVYEPGGDYRIKN